MMTSPIRTIAVILSGGRSRRMGQDKGLMVSQGVSWVQHLYQTLSALALPVYVSVNAQQQSTYQKTVSPNALIVDSVGDAMNGPLVGLLSAAQQHPQSHILVVPCDMLELSAETFRTWHRTFYEQYPAHQVLVCQTSDRLQPLCGIYGQTGLQVLQTLAHQNQLRNRSMHDLLENELRTYRWSVPADMLPQFKNYNTPGDLP